MKSKKKVTRKVIKKSKKFEPPKIKDYFTHNGDFSAVVMKHPSSEGFEFVLNPSQARVVKVLFENFVEGVPWVATEKLIERYGKQNSMQKVFKDIKNWKTLIKLNEKRMGLYRLNLPFHPEMFKTGDIIFSED